MFGTGLKSRKIPKYGQEAPQVQMRIIRSHMAGQADTLSTILTIVQDCQNRLRQLETGGVCCGMPDCVNADPAHRVAAQRARDEQLGPCGHPGHPQTSHHCESGGVALAPAAFR